MQKIIATVILLTAASVGAAQTSEDLLRQAATDAYNDAGQTYTECMEILSTKGNTPEYQACLQDFGELMETYQLALEMQREIPAPTPDENGDVADARDPNTVETVEEILERVKTLSSQAIENSSECRRISISAEISGVEEPAFSLTECLQASNAMREEAAALHEKAGTMIAALQEEIYHWKLIDEGASLIDDSPTLALYRVSRQKNSCNLGDGTSVFVMRCVEGNMAVFFELDGCLYSGLTEAGRNGLIRIGDEPAQHFELAGDGTVFAITNPEDIVPLIKGMFFQQRLVLRAYPFSSPQQTIEFDISGIEQRIEPLREACSW